MTTYPSGGWLEGVDHVVCPQHSTRRDFEVDTIVLHYSVGGGDARSALSYFANRPQRSASYHFVTGRDGVTAQGVPVHRAAWHAKGIAVGEPKYKPGQNNRRSIGWCFCNWGFSTPDRPDYQRAKHPKTGRVLYWEPYPDEQIAGFRAQLSRVLEMVPTVRYVTGHESNAYGKSDPGPAFPWLDALGGTGLIKAWNTWPSGRDGDAEWQYLTMRGGA